MNIDYINNFDHDYSADICIQIEMVGDVRGYFTLYVSHDVMSEILKRMYGFELEASMLDSFASELWNMILGAIVTSVSTVKIDITPPVTLEEKSLVPDNGAYLCFYIKDVGNIFVCYLNKSGGDK
jgi:CheY-specific phosphatase CheX